MFIVVSTRTDQKNTFLRRQGWRWQDNCFGSDRACACAGRGQSAACVDRSRTQSRASFRSRYRVQACASCAWPRRARIGS